MAKTGVVALCSSGVPRGHLPRYRIFMPAFSLYTSTHRSNVGKSHCRSEGTLTLLGGVEWAKTQSIQGEVAWAEQCWRKQAGWGTWLFCRAGLVMTGFLFQGCCCLAAVSKRAQGASSAHVLGPAIRQHMHQSVGSKRNID